MKNRKRLLITFCIIVGIGAATIIALAMRDITETDIAEAVGEGWVSGEHNNTENTKEIYWEKTENLGLSNKSIVRLESNPDNSDLRVVIDGNSVNLESEEERIYENYNFTKIIKSDFDKDGIMEIVLLFFGGSSGTYQDFRVIKFNGKTWEVIHRDFENRDDTPFVNVKALENNCIQIDVEKTGYNKIVKLPKNKYLTEEGEKAEVGTGYRFFELQDDNIIVAYRVYVKNVGNGIGDVRQKIEFDENSGKLVLGETSYMAIKEAKERAYEGY